MAATALEGGVASLCRAELAAVDGRESRREEPRSKEEEWMSLDEASGARGEESSGWEDVIGSTAARCQSERRDEGAADALVEVVRDVSEEERCLCKDIDEFMLILLYVDLDVSEGRFELTLSGD